jgi:hypothetical protein
LTPERVLAITVMMLNMFDDDNADECDNVDYAYYYDYVDDDGYCYAYGYD